MEQVIRSNRFEESLVYVLSGERREVALVHGPDVRVMLGQIPAGAEPEEGYFCELSLEEARMRLAFFRDLEQRGLL